MVEQNRIFPKELADWVTFRQNFNHPIHNWFYFKEGFSKELVEWLVEEFALKGPIYDPFCGAGTTLLAAKEHGIEALGIDVSPLAVFVSNVKTRNYCIEKLKSAYNALASEKIPLAESTSKVFRRYFYSETLREICGLKSWLEKLDDEKTKNFFMLALIDSSAKVALVKKQGRSLRRIKRRKLPIKKIFLNKAFKMIRDLQHAKLSDKEPSVFEADARTFVPERKANAIITSPPYLNKDEYTTAYKLELGLFFNYEKTKLNRYIGDSMNSLSKQYSWLPLEAQAYFCDMEKAIENMHKSINKSKLAFMVVGGGCFPKGTIEPDEIIEEIAEGKGFKVTEKIVARHVPCMRARTKLIGKTRESIIVMEK